MRELIKAESKVIDLISKIDNLEKTFYIDKFNVKLCLRLTRKCDICNGYFNKKQVKRFKDGTYMCWTCIEHSKKYN